MSYKIDSSIEFYSKLAPANQSSLKRLRDWSDWPILEESEIPHWSFSIDWVLSPFFLIFFDEKIIFNQHKKHEEPINEKKLAHSKGCQNIT